jgi:hypothetical protein
MATDRRENPRYGPATTGDCFGELFVKSFLILFAAVAPPALLYATLSETDFAAVREIAPWALMLLGFGGMAVSLRARVRPRPPIPGGRLRRDASRPERAEARSGALRRRTTRTHPG